MRRGLVCVLRQRRFHELGSHYSPSLVERSDKVWPPSKRRDRVFSMVLPPPNVTGQLHLGHALTVAVQDAMIRRKRQEGFETVWVPGVDHAGIATQVVVEKQLRAEQSSRLELGREAFVERVMQWKQLREADIVRQMRRMGVAMDWDRFTFTLDPPYAEAVTELFCRLYEQGLIYRGSRAVNWCPALQSVVSDIEVDLKHTPDALLHYVDYGNGIVVATTRPETIAADVAVAVHPDDARYVGITQCRNPLTGELLPVIRDALLVDPAKGTGAVKVTPAHSVEDHECGLRHGLPMDVTAFDERGRMHQGGQDRLAARSTIVERLAKEGKVIRSEKQPEMRVPTCSRSGDLLEPSWKPQWFVDTREMAKRALSYGSDIIPEKFQGEWSHFLSESRDWCISRQLWWGHRIPAYLVDGKWVVSRTPPPEFDSQDEDVLDTWFSSALFPLAPLGWPKQLDRRLYPLSVMETGSDILFFWVARMAMICSQVEPDAGAPFRRVALHPMVRDKFGRKMSKSVGNVIDPVDLIEGRSLDELIANVQRNMAKLSEQEIRTSVAALRKEYPQGMPECGVDALRFTLIDSDSSDTVNLDVAVVEANTRMCNKIWNAAKFVLSRRKVLEPQPAIREAERWLVAHLQLLSNQMLTGFETDNLHRCTRELRSFLLLFCDHYIEYAKHCAEDDACVNYHLHHAFECFLTHLHPFMPFLSEHLLGVEDGTSLTVPQSIVAVDSDRDVEPFAKLLALASAVRQLKTVRQRPFRVWIQDSSIDLDLVCKMARTDVIQVGIPDESCGDDVLVIPVRGHVTIQVHPKQEQSADSDDFIHRKLERLSTKLQKLDEKMAKMDQSRMRPEVRETFLKTRAVLVEQIKSLEKNV